VLRNMCACGVDVSSSHFIYLLIHPHSHLPAQSVPSSHIHTMLEIELGLGGCEVKLPFQKPVWTLFFKNSPEPALLKSLHYLPTLRHLLSTCPRTRHSFAKLL